jgi:hypothetical protein
MEVYNERLFIIFKNGLINVLNDQYSTIYSFKTLCDPIDSFSFDRFENIAVLCKNIFLNHLNGTLLNELKQRTEIGEELKDVLISKNGDVVLTAKNNSIYILN